MTEEKPKTDPIPGEPEYEPEYEQEDEWEEERKKPEEKMPRGFYPALALIGILVILILVLNVPGTRASAGSALSEGNWTLQSYANATGTLLPVTPGSAVTARFTDGRVSGSAGCNRYSGTYSVNELLITVTNPVSTEMFCPGPGIMEQETAYLGDLKKASSFRVGPGYLKIYDHTGNPLLEFAPA